MVIRKITLRKMGRSIGATVPKDMAERFNIDIGDEVFIVETENGILITPYDPDFERGMAAYKKTAVKYRKQRLIRIHPP